MLVSEFFDRNDGSDGFKISPIEKEDKEEILQLCGRTFGHLVGHEAAKSYTDSASDWDISVKATLDGKIVGCYMLARRNLPASLLKQNDLSQYIDKRGVEGVALAMDPSMRGRGYGKQLRDYPLTLTQFDYIWGQHMEGLKNLENWKKFGRIVLTPSTSPVHITFMPLKKLKDSDLKESFDKHHRYQPDGISCGPTCMKMVADYLGIPAEHDELMDLTGCNDQTGTIDTGIKNCLDHWGVKYKQPKLSNAKSAIGYLQGTLKEGDIFIMRTLTHGVKHWIVVHGFDGEKYLIADPWLGKIKYTQKEIINIWAPRNFDGFRVYK